MRRVLYAAAAAVGLFLGATGALWVWYYLQARRSGQVP